MRIEIRQLDVGDRDVGAGGGRRPLDDRVARLSAPLDEGRGLGELRALVVGVEHLDRADGERCDDQPDRYCPQRPGRGGRDSPMASARAGHDEIRFLVVQTLSPTMLERSRPAGVATVRRRISTVRDVGRGTAK